MYGYRQQQTVRGLIVLTPGQVATQDDNGQYRVPLRVDLTIDLDFVAYALALEWGSAPRREGSGWRGKVGRRRAQEACVALVQRRVHGLLELPVSEETLDGWKQYVVQHFGLFPEDALG